MDTESISMPMTFNHPEGDTTTMKLDSDPLGYLLRSDTGFAILEELKDGLPLSPVKVRHGLSLHPQTLKEAVDHLNGYGLLTLQIPRGSKARRVTKGVALPVVLQITSEGQEVLHLAEGAREYIQRKVEAREKHLPASTVERWMPA